MRKIVMLLAIMLGMIACEEKDISLFPSFEESAKFNINTNSFEEDATIYSSVISDAVIEATDGEGGVERLVLEGLWFEVTPNSGNTAQAMTLTFQIKSWATDEYLPILEDFTFTVNSGKVNFLKELKSEGVIELKNQLNAIAKGLPSSDIKFESEGIVTPEGGTVDVDVEVFVNATVVYTTTVGI